MADAKNKPPGTYGKDADGNRTFTPDTSVIKTKADWEALLLWLQENEPDVIPVMAKPEWASDYEKAYAEASGPAPIELPDNYREGGRTRML
jgi:hypothetical protein